MAELATTITDVPVIVVTSINDGKHGNNSRHYRNEAIDIRSKNFPNVESKEIFRSYYETALGSKFRVLLEYIGTENEHFHAQVKRGYDYAK